MREENQTIIKALNMFGRVPETWELLNEIERLNNIINELEKESHLGMIENTANNDYSKGLNTAYEYINNKVKELKGSDKNEDNRFIK